MVLLLCVEESHPRVLVRRIVWPLANQVGPRTVSQALQRALPLIDGKQHPSPQRRAAHRAAPAHRVASGTSRSRSRGRWPRRRRRQARFRSYMDGPPRRRPFQRSPAAPRAAHDRTTLAEHRSERSSSPRTRSRNCSVRSSTKTRAPAHAMHAARDAPASPPPTITSSYVTWYLVQRVASAARPLRRAYRE